jgi:hypothetical protein
MVEIERTGIQGESGAAVSAMSVFGYFSGY